MSTENEQRYFDALKRITLYQSVERLRRSSEKDWGVEYPEALEMAYENVKSDAERAIRGKRRPRDPKTTPEVSDSTRDVAQGAEVDLDKHAMEQEG